MRRGLLYRYLIPSSIDYVMLRPLNIYGFMESGKTTLSLKISARIEEEVGDKHGFICLLGRRQKDILTYLEENPDVVRGNQYVIMVYDDAGRYYLSRESSTQQRREDVKDFLEIRHFFEKVGMNQGVIVPIFNIQYYNLLEKSLRNTPASIWKTTVLMDRRDKRDFVMTVGWKYYYFLKVITRAMYLDRYVLTRGEIGLQGTRGDQIYDFLVEYFRSKGAPEAEGGGVILHRDFVKRFTLLVLLDEKAIVDFGPEVKSPRNLITVEPASEEENWWMPETQEEKRKILWWISILTSVYGIPVEDVINLLRQMGLRFRTELFSSIRREAVEHLSSGGEPRGKGVKVQVFTLGEVPTEETP